MKTIKQLKSEILELERQKAELDEQLTSAIKNAMIKIAQENKRPLSGGKGFTVKSSELTSHTWDPSFYNWEETVKMLYAYLENKEPVKWIEILQEMLDKSKDKQTVSFVVRYSGPRSMSYTCKISYAFVKFVIEELQN